MTVGNGPYSDIQRVRTKEDGEFIVRICFLIGGVLGV